MAMSVRTMPKVVDFASVEAISLRVRIVTADTIDTPTHASVMPGPGNNPVRTVCCKNCIVHGMALALTSLPAKCAAHWHLVAANHSSRSMRAGAHLRVRHAGSARVPTGDSVVARGVREASAMQGQARSHQHSMLL